MSTYRKQVPQSTSLLGAEKTADYHSRARKRDLLPGERFRKRLDTVTTCNTNLPHWCSVHR